MRIHRIELQAFGPFAGRETVDLEPLNDAGLFLLDGPTGAGKSTVLSAVCYALYGSIPGRRSVDTLASTHAAPGARPEAGPDQAALRPEPGRTPLGGLTLRSTADTAQTTASLKAPATASKPWCAQERRVGTGQGFCLVN